MQFTRVVGCWVAELFSSGVGGGAVSEGGVKRKWRFDEAATGRKTKRTGGEEDFIYSPSIGSEVVEQRENRKSATSGGRRRVLRFLCKRKILETTMSRFALSLNDLQGRER